MLQLCLTISVENHIRPAWQNIWNQSQTWSYQC